MNKTVIEITACTICDGELVRAGEIVEASEQAARQLIGSGKAIHADDDAAPRDYEADTIEEMILLAIADLDPDDEDHFTADNKPQVAALEELLDMEITADQRDTAWAIAVERMG